MRGRSYSDDPRRDAADIAHDVILDGFSEGWCGQPGQMEAARAILAPMGIRYVDDMRGRWTGPTQVTVARTELAVLAFLKELVIDPDTLPTHRYEPGLEAACCVLNGRPVPVREVAQPRVDFKV